MVKGLGLLLNAILLLQFRFAEEFLSGSQHVFLIPVFFQLSVLQEEPAKPDENHTGKFLQGL